MTINGGDYYDPNLPLGVDLVDIGVEEDEGMKPCERCDVMFMDELCNGICDDCIDLSECCTANITCSGLCSDCKEHCR